MSEAAAEIPSEVAAQPSGDEVLAEKPPKWLNPDFFQKALREGLKDPSIVIDRCDVRPANAKGENYASIVYRCTAWDVEGKEHRSIIKCLPSNAMRKMFCNKAEIFRKERDMYTIIFPKYEEMLSEAEEGRKDFPWVTFYYDELDGKSDSIVLRDVGPDGFTMVDRKKGLDREHLGLVLKALAEFHACSVALELTSPEDFKAKVVDLYPEFMYTAENKEMNKWSEKAVEKLVGEVKGWGGEKYEGISGIMSEWKETIYDDIVELLEPKEGAVLCHGDAWVNNMLFKYGTGEGGRCKPVEVKLLDFQISRYSSPAADLLYLMVSSTTSDTRNLHWNQLLEHAYVENFWKALASHGVKGDVRGDLYSLQWFKKEMRRLGKWSVYNAAAVLPIIVLESEDVPDLDSLTEEDMKMETDFFKPSNTNLFRERCRGLIDDFANDGLFQ